MAPVIQERAGNGISSHAESSNLVLRSQINKRSIQGVDGQDLTCSARTYAAFGEGCTVEVLSEVWSGCRVAERCTGHESMKVEFSRHIRPRVLR